MSWLGGIFSSLCLLLRLPECLISMDTIHSYVLEGAFFDIFSQHAYFATRFTTA